jgi:hypothetical protein
MKPIPYLHNQNYTRHGPIPLDRSVAASVLLRWRQHTKVRRKTALAGDRRYSTGCAGDFQLILLPQC